MSDDAPATRWTNGPGERYAAHSHDYDKILEATAGSIMFHLTELERDVELHAGDRLELPAGTVHGATVGPQGVVCLETHLAAGSLGLSSVGRTAVTNTARPRLGQTRSPD